MRPPRTLPHRPEAEFAVLGGVLLRGVETLAVVLATCDESDFYQPRAQAVLRGMVALAERGEPIDVITLEAQLRRTGDLELVGGIEGLARLDRYATPHNIRAHARLVREAALVRRMVEVAREIAEQGMGEIEDVGEYLRRAETAVVAIAREHAEEQPMEKPREPEPVRARALAFLDLAGPALARVAAAPVRDASRRAEFAAEVERIRAISIGSDAGPMLVDGGEDPRMTMIARCAAVLRLDAADLDRRAAEVAEEMAREVESIHAVIGRTRRQSDPPTREQKAVAGYDVAALRDALAPVGADADTWTDRERLAALLLGPTDAQPPNVEAEIKPLDPRLLVVAALEAVEEREAVLHAAVAEKARRLADIDAAADDPAYTLAAADIDAEVCQGPREDLDLARRVLIRQVTRVEASDRWPGQGAMHDRAHAQARRVRDGGKFGRDEVLVARLSLGLGRR